MGQLVPRKPEPPPPPPSRQAPIWFPGQHVQKKGGGAHRARTVHLFYLDNLRDAIVLLCCCPVRSVLLSWSPISPCMPSGLHCTCYSSVYSPASLSWVCAGTPVFYNRGNANERVPATILAPHNALVITYSHNMR